LQTKKERIGEKDIKVLRNTFLRTFLAAYLKGDPEWYNQNVNFIYCRETGTVYVYSKNPGSGPGVVYILYPLEQRDKLSILKASGANDVIQDISVKDKWGIALLERNPSIDEELGRIDLRENHSEYFSVKIYHDSSKPELAEMHLSELEGVLKSARSLGKEPVLVLDYGGPDWPAQEPGIPYITPAMVKQAMERGNRRLSSFLDQFQNY